MKLVEGEGRKGAMIGTGNGDNAKYTKEYGKRKTPGKEKKML